MNKRPVVVLIMDGYGLGPHDGGDAVFLAKTPVLDELFNTCPNTILMASGKDVGLPEGQIGNSEVGHTNIGAGRIVYQNLPRISKATENGSFFENPAYISAMDSAKQSGGSLHLLGLMSDGGVHSHYSHVWALLEMAKLRGLDRVYIHAFLDGRDVPPKSGKDCLAVCVEKCRQIGIGRIATVMGRFYAMDRDNRWERIERAYNAMVLGKAPIYPDPVRAVEDSYDSGVTDEFMEPVICDSEGAIKSGDSVIFFNFRPDRAREITYALTMKDFTAFDRRAVPEILAYACTTQYDEQLTLPIAFPTEEITMSFGEYISSLGLKQLRIAETEKYAHVTFFFNGGVELPFFNEDRVLIPSPKQFPTYDMIPQMSAYKITDEAVDRIASGEYGVIIMNYANCDMVGHTGVLQAAIDAVEAVDKCVGRITKLVRKMGGVCLITADHGNADRMLDADGNPHTAHTVNPVPLIICGIGAGAKLRPGRLADIAPTALDIMGFGKPDKMTGSSLIFYT